MAIQHDLGSFNCTILAPRRATENPVSAVRSRLQLDCGGITCWLGEDSSIADFAAYVRKEREHFQQFPVIIDFTGEHEDFVFALNGLPQKKTVLVVDATQIEWCSVTKMLLTSNELIRSMLAMQPAKVFSITNGLFQKVPVVTEKAA